jgi:ketosteroid isomerase-like protein
MPDARTIFGAVDSKDLDAMRAMLAENPRFVMSNNDPLIGKDAVMAGNAGFFTMIQGSRHEVLHEWAVGTATIAETEVTYQRLDGKEVTVPAVTIWEVDEAGLITNLRIYADQTPLFAS